MENFKTLYIIAILYFFLKDGKERILRVALNSLHYIIITVIKQYIYIYILLNYLFEVYFLNRFRWMNGSFFLLHIIINSF